jgi:hypothetical protein
MLLIAAVVVNGDRDRDGGSGSGDNGNNGNCAGSVRNSAD